jgi:D-glycero-D-manno-heptose 1,7-bisphosphate phosphatase
MKRAVFFDRDGTLIEDAGYLSAPEEVEVLPGAPQAVRRFNRAGFLVVVASNQSGVARGMYTTDDVDRVNERLRQLFAAEGARIDAFYYCPHLSTGTVPAYAKECECRKPKPGMLYEAAQDLDIDLTESFMVGDSLRDVQAGRKAQCRSILVGSAAELDAETLEGLEALAAPLAHNLLEVAELILPAAEEEEDDETAEPVEPGAAIGADESEAPDPSPAPEGVHSEPQKEEEPDMPDDAVAEVTCHRCGRTIQPREFETGRAIRRQGHNLCPACVQELRSRRLPTNGASIPELSAILEELRNITRELTFETFSLLNVLGGVLQVGALYFFFRAYREHVAGSPAESSLLLWAILVQLMTLTCFVVGRRR